MRTRPRRPGTTLVLFALFLLVLLGTLALVVDLGLAMLTQRQMQSAADAAALEGLRGHGEDPDQPLRERASAFVQWHFDDDLGTDSQPHRLGGANFDVQKAGANSQFTRVNVLSAPALPPPELNEDNVSHGDLVRGQFDANQEHAEHRYEDPYNRDDFDPQATASGKPPAFLVRLRRSRDTQGNATDARDAEPGVSSSGNALPLLFGQAAMIPHNHPLKTRGIPVRATAIAEGQPAVSVGLVNATEGIPGVLPFAVGLADWNSLAVDSPDDRPAIKLAIDAPVAIGALVLNEPPPPPSDQALQTYLPIYKNYPSGNRVIGFGFASVEMNGQGVTVTKRPGIVARQNALASLTTAIVSPTEINDVFAARKEILEPLRAPALVR